MNITSIEISNSNSYNIYFDNTICQCDIENQLYITLAEVEAIITEGLIPVSLSYELIKTYKQLCEDWLKERRHTGFNWNDYIVPADAEAQANFSSVMILIGLGATGPFLLHDNNNVDHWLTIAEVQALCVQMATFVQGAYQACWTAKASIDAATTIEQCDQAISTLNIF